MTESAHRPGVEIGNSRDGRKRRLEWVLRFFCGGLASSGPLSHAGEGCVQRLAQALDDRFWLPCPEDEGLGEEDMVAF